MIEEKDLAELCATILTGVTVGIGSLILLFASGAQVLVQCTFQCIERGNVRRGHGEQSTDSSLLFEYLNHTVESAELDNESVLTLNFEDGKHLKIIPERNGLESYVVTTRFGICPVIATWGAIYGAIGAAASAALTPFAANAITGGDPNVTPGQAAAIAVFATFAGGAAAGLAGQNAAAGALAAQNEAINNCLGHSESCAQMAKNALSYLRGPDFVNFQIDYYVGSVWGTFTRDGNSFVGGGLNMALPNTVNAGVGISAGWLNMLTVAPGQTNNFAGGYAGGVSGAYDLVGGGIMYSPGNGTATVLGIGAGVNLGKTTNIGTVGGGYSVDQGKTGIKWWGSMPSFPFSSGPRSRRSRAVFVLAFTAMMGFIVYVVLKNIFHW